jgi:hypothetical protein
MWFRTYVLENRLINGLAETDDPGDCKLAANQTVRRGIVCLFSGIAVIAVIPNFPGSSTPLLRVEAGIPFLPATVRAHAAVSGPDGKIKEGCPVYGDRCKRCVSTIMYPGYEPRWVSM